MSTARLLGAAAVAAVAAFADVPLARAAPISPTLAGEEVHVVVESAFGPVIDGVAVVAAGVEFTGANAIWTYQIDLSDDGFAVTVSKPFAAGNFTGIFGSILIEGLRHEVSSVVFDAAASSAFSSGDPNGIDLGTPGQILVDFGPGHASGNSPATALSHTYRWNVVLGDELPVTAVPEPSGLALMGLGLALAGWGRRPRP